MHFQIFLVRVRYSRNLFLQMNHQLDLVVTREINAIDENSCIDTGLLLFSFEFSIEIGLINEEFLLLYLHSIFFFIHSTRNIRALKIFLFSDSLVFNSILLWSEDMRG